MLHDTVIQHGSDSLAVPHFYKVLLRVLNQPENSRVAKPSVALLSWLVPGSTARGSIGFSILHQHYHLSGGLG